jgi:putative FmdB family regulatory protein
MPIYEYECGSCGRRFDQLQRITDDALTTDPECGGQVRRVIQPVGIIFKGSGFYATDSRKSSSASSTASSDSKDSGDSKSETKSESKSDSKSESSSSSSKSSGDSKSTAASAA